ncbi:efflux RND transporter permease subunit [Acinetobacter baumannii]
MIETVYDRSSLVDKAIKTVAKNLIEGAIFSHRYPFYFLGNFRAALITACIIHWQCFLLNRYGGTKNQCQPDESGRFGLRDHC